MPSVTSTVAADFGIGYAPSGRDELLRALAAEGASRSVCEALGIPPEWAQRCEDSAHLGHDGNVSTLHERLDKMRAFNGFPGFENKMTQLGSYGGGNHFGECEIVHVENTGRAREAAAVFGLRDRHVAFLSHCGSRG